MQDTAAIFEPPDWTDPLPNGVALLSAGMTDDGRLRVEVSGAENKRVRAAIADRLRMHGELEVVPRRLEPRRCVGYMEREARRLQLRYVVSGDEHLDDIIVAEDERRVVVFGVMCLPLTDGYDGRDVECPYHVYLNEPLGDRKVIDGFAGEAVPYKNVYVDIQRRIDNWDERDSRAHPR